MIDNHVSAFFHGHDHQYAYEVRDGIVYQSMPRPSIGLDFNYYSESDPYTERVIGNSGHLRVTVTPNQTTVEYVRSNQTGVSHSYTIEPYISGPTHVLTTAVDPAAGGTISPAAGTHTYPQGQTVEVTATPNQGYEFDHWSGACTGDGTCSVTMTADRSVTANFAAVAGNVSSAATPSDSTLTAGESVVVTINVDMSEVEAPYDALGSFTASLAWNPAVLAFDSYSGPLAGFTGAVNTANVGSGQIVFNGANFNGATGNIVTFQVTLHAIGAGTSDLDLEYSAMAAATTFKNLWSILTVNDGLVTVGAPQYTLTVGVSPSCLLYTSDAADDLLCVDLGGRRIIKNKTTDTIATHM